MKPKSNTATGPRRYPLALKKFLIVTLPALKNKPQRRTAAWREFARSDTAHGTNWIGRGTIGDYCEWLKAGNEIQDDGGYMILARTFLTWYADWRKQKTIRERRAAGFKRHKKTGARPNDVLFKRKTGLSLKEIRNEIKKCLLT